jgi:LmbE family N-acetylglucosaminyl deacetylase
LLELIRESERRGGLNVLAIGAHADDIEIGCGGTILRLGAERLLSSVRWVVLSAADEREAEARKGAEAFLQGVDQVEVLVERFRDGFFPYVGEAIKTYFEEHRDSFEPDLILTPRRDDLHQDHRLVGELTWNTYRKHLIMEYEIPKYDGDLGSPNLYVELSQEICDRKIDIVLATFRTQSPRRWFDPDAFRGLMRLRGMESNTDSRFAEGFMCRKVVLRASEADI